MIRKFTHEEIVARQIAASRLGRVPLVVVLDNIRSLLNVGAIFRAADGMGVERLMLCGITGYPPQGGIAKTALGAEESVRWEYHQDVVAVVKTLKQKGFEIVALEQTSGALSFEAYRPKGPVCLIVGNEVEGISEALISLCDVSVEIPMAGIKNSLNVAVAFGVAGFMIASHLRSVSPRQA